MKSAAKTDASLPIILFEERDAWEAWLAKNGASLPGTWLRLAKKGVELKSISYAEALDGALCYGWIDSQKKSFDAESWLQRFTPRGAKSIWSKINRGKAIGLIESGRMRAAGLAEIKKAKADGRWEAAYDSHRTAVPPEDFEAALDRSPKAKEFFLTLNSQNRYAILFRIQTAKKIETRRKRIDEFVTMLEDNRKLYP